MLSGMLLFTRQARRDRADRAERACRAGALMRCASPKSSSLSSPSSGHLHSMEHGLVQLSYLFATHIQSSALLNDVRL